MRIASTWDGRPAHPGEVVTVAFEARSESLRVIVEAPFHDDPPPPGNPGPTPGLWEFEVVELFVADEARPPRYLEVELSPHGHHLLLQLEGIRRPVAEGLELEYRAQIDHGAGRWRGEAGIPWLWLPSSPQRVNAFALYGAGAARRHLAWSPLPGRRPDFHQPHRFPRFLLRA